MLKSGGMRGLAFVEEASSGCSVGTYGTLPQIPKLGPNVSNLRRWCRTGKSSAWMIRIGTKLPILYLDRMAVVVVTSCKRKVGFCHGVGGVRR